MSATPPLDPTANPDNWQSLVEPVAWRPTPAYIERSRLVKFMRRLGVATYDELVERAAADPAWFWDAVPDDLGLVWRDRYSQVMDTSRGPQWTTWYKGGKLNYVDTALDKHASGPSAQRDALVWEGEDGEIRRFTYAELLRLTNQAAHAMRALGIGKGDRVGIFMPMIPEVVAATLACGKIGAIFTPIFSGYGADAIATRLAASGAKLLVTADGFHRRGKIVPMKETADAAVSSAPDIQHVLVARRTGADVPWRDGRDVWWDDAIKGQPVTFENEVTDAEDPYMLIYTSGTTGKPKGAVHTHCGFPLKGAQDMAHCFDLQESDTLFWLTDMGWMMGPWAVSGALMLGATLLIYEGATDYPDTDRMWALASKHKVTVMGISPTVVRSLMTHGDEPVKRHDLSALRVLGSTGEPWNAGPWRWLFEVVGDSRLPIINYSGGTEISGGIIGAATITPIKPCSFSGPVPGMAADVVDDSGAPVRGRVGELIIRQPWPGMTRGFWNEPERYESSYWARFPGVWTHGDFAAIDGDGFWYILGRSDDTIKVAGKRLGPAEVESAAVAHPSVAEAAAIGAPHPVKGEVVNVFVVLKPGVEVSEALRDEIKAAVARALGPASSRTPSTLSRNFPRHVMARCFAA